MYILFSKSKSEAGNALGAGLPIGDSFHRLSEADTAPKGTNCRVHGDDKTQTVSAPKMADVYNLLVNKRSPRQTARPRQQRASSSTNGLALDKRPPLREMFTSSDSKTSCLTASHDSQHHISQCGRPLDGFYCLCYPKITSLSL